MPRPRQLFYLLLLVGLLGGCGSAEEPAGQGSLWAQPAKPQEKLKVKELETDRLILTGTDTGVLHQDEVQGVIRRTHLDVLALAVWRDAALTMYNKRMPPRVVHARVEGTHLTFPGPAEADRVLVRLPQLGDATYTIDVPRPPPEGAPPVSLAEAIILQVQDPATQPQGIPVRWEGYAVAAGLTFPTTIVPRAYYRIEFDGTGWVLVAMAAH